MVKMRASTPTGRVRYRENWWGNKLILQVEVEGVATFRRYHGDIGYTELVKSWRDARLSDIWAGAFYGNMPSIIVRDSPWPKRQAGHSDG